MRSTHESLTDIGMSTCACASLRPHKFGLCLEKIIRIACKYTFVKNYMHNMHLHIFTDDPGSSQDHKYARISYGRFITIRYKFKRSTYFLEPLVTGGWNREREKRENGGNGHGRDGGWQCGWKAVETNRC
jgi:hypothetical protein